MPQLLAIEVPAPDAAQREHFIDNFVSERQQTGQSPMQQAPPVPTFWAEVPQVARFTAGLSLHAPRQLLLGAAHADTPVSPRDVIGKVERYISSQLGDDVVEFKMPGHTLADVIGFTRLKEFLAEEMIPRMRSTGADA